MTVKELKDILFELDDDLIIVLSRDPEGNGYAKAETHEEMVYRSGEVGYSELTTTLRAEGYTDEDIISGARALVLWP